MISARRRTFDPWTDQQRSGHEAEGMGLPRDADAGGKPRGQPDQPHGRVYAHNHCRHQQETPIPEWTQASLPPPEQANRSAHQSEHRPGCAHQTGRAVGVNENVADRAGETARDVEGQKA